MLSGVATSMTRGHHQFDAGLADGLAVLRRCRQARRCQPAANPYAMFAAPFKAGMWELWGIIYVIEQRRIRIICSFRYILNECVS